MRKRFWAFILSFTILFSLVQPVEACNEQQTNVYEMQLLFGKKASKYENDNNVKMLMSALYLCSEQRGENGKDKLKILKNGKVKKLPKFDDIKITKENELLSCSHNLWEEEVKSDKKNNRKRVLIKTADKVCDFDNSFWDSIVGNNNEKCDSFAAYMYYSHILSDYLADNPNETETTLKKGYVPAFSGIDHVEVNGNNPQFTNGEKESIDYFAKLSALDAYGRTGVAFANISKENLPEANSRQDIGDIKPSGWHQNKYDEVSSKPGYVYNRCHLIAHQLIGVDTRENLITGTRYLNEAMIPFENMVCDYVRETGNHVLYRATPVYKKSNLLASGVQLEAYSVEDKGKGISFNIYLYNVQPGVDLDYANGDNSQADILIGNDDVIPFAVADVTGRDTDLMAEMQKQLGILFNDQKNKKNYNRMMQKLNDVAGNARACLAKEKDVGKQYIELNKYKYQYYEVLREYVPRLLQKENFFKATFN